MIKLFTDSDFIDPSIRKNFPEDFGPIEMSSFDSAYLCGLLKKFRPKNILEVGVAAGGTTAIILEAIRAYGLEATLTSVDLNEGFYKNKAQGTENKTGWLARERFGEPENWHLATGKYLPEVIESFGKKFDFCVLDTVHYLPGELLDYPVLMPFMELGGLFIIHDTLYHQYSNPDGHSNTLVFDVAVGNKIICLNADAKQWKKLTNIGGMVVTQDTMRYMGNVFLALSMPWKTRINPHQVEIYHQFYHKFYGPECARMFLWAYEMNQGAR